METLPAEMVERIVVQLTPKDLAHCAAVCRDWREVFNQDWIWRPLCEAELEERLRTTACAATPAFESPEARNSTLTPICQWRLAFIRETHLWKNWEETEVKCDNENIHSIENKDLLHLDFLTDTLVVVWYRNSIEVLDVSVKPPVCKAKTDASFIQIQEHEKLEVVCSVVGTTMLLVEKRRSFIVYSVDMSNKVIMLIHNVTLEQATALIGPSLQKHVKDHFYLFVDTSRSILQIFDLITGTLLKEEPYPVSVNRETDNFCYLKGSSTSDFVVVVFKTETFTYKYHFYDINNLTFLPGVVVELSKPFNRSKYKILRRFPGPFQVALHQQWFAYHDSKMLTVYSLREKEVLLSHKINCYLTIHVFGNTFVVWENILRSKELGWIKSYSPVHNTWSIIYEGLRIPMYGSVIQNKFLLESSTDKSCFWKISAEKIKKIYFRMDMCKKSVCKINQSCTKMLYMTLEPTCCSKEQTTAHVIHFW